MCVEMQTMNYPLRQMEYHSEFELANYALSTPFQNFIQIAI